MSKREVPLKQLADYLPEGASEKVISYLNQYSVHLTVTKARKSILGDYRHATWDHHHRISVNGSLNRYAFLITLIHEMAHLITFLQHGNKVNAHGKEWKLAYRAVLEDFIALKVFPKDIVDSLHKSLHNLPASSCADERLTRVLRNYDPVTRMVLVEQVAEGSLFLTPPGKLFKRGKKIRKRIECVEMETGKLYLFSPVYEVEIAAISSE
jgi:SprT protein